MDLVNWRKHCFGVRPNLNWRIKFSSQLIYSKLWLASKLPKPCARLFYLVHYRDTLLNKYKIRHPYFNKMNATFHFEIIPDAQNVLERFKILQSPRPGMNVRVHFRKHWRCTSNSQVFVSFYTRSVCDLFHCTNYTTRLSAFCLVLANLDAPNSRLIFSPRSPVVVFGILLLFSCIFVGELFLYCFWI